MQDEVGLRIEFKRAVDDVNYLLSHGKLHREALDKVKELKIKLKIIDEKIDSLYKK